MIAPDDDPLAPLRTVAALHALGLINSWEIPPVADAMLSSGVYSDSLAELAAITDAKMSDVAPLLGRAMRECGVEQPTRIDAAWTAARWCVHLVATMPDSPRKYVNLLLDDLVIAALDVLPHGEYWGDGLDATHFVWIQDDYREPVDNYDTTDARAMANEAERISSLDSLARQAAHEWLSRHPTPHQP